MMSVLLALECPGILAAAIFGVLWLYHPMGPYEPLTFLALLIGTSIAELIRRYIPEESPGLSATTGILSTSTPTVDLPTRLEEISNDRLRKAVECILIYGEDFSVADRKWFTLADITTNWALAYTTFVEQGTLDKDIHILMSHFPRTKNAGESLEELDYVLLERALSRMKRAGWLETKDNAWFEATGYKLTALGRSVVLEQLTDSDGRVTLSNPVLTKESVTATTPSLISRITSRCSRRAARAGLWFLGGMIAPLAAERQALLTINADSGY